MRFLVSMHLQRSSRGTNQAWQATGTQQHMNPMPYRNPSLRTVACLTDPRWRSATAGCMVTISSPACALGRPRKMGATAAPRVDATRARRLSLLLWESKQGAVRGVQRRRCGLARRAHGVLLHDPRHAQVVCRLDRWRKSCRRCASASSVGGFGCRSHPSQRREQLPLRPYPRVPSSG